MSVIVRDDGFHREAPQAAGPAVAELAPEADPEALEAAAREAELIRILFPVFSDGRGFTLARRLRAAGYAGRLRAVGPLLCDQYAMARRSGFDEVEIPDDHARRHAERDWLARADWRGSDYRARIAPRAPTPETPR